jgi:hypothetical protein
VPLGKSAVVVGAGRVGEKAARSLIKIGFSRVVVVDPDGQALSRLRRETGSIPETVVAEGIRWLHSQARSLPPSTWIIPAAPVHLAYEWLLLELGPRARPAPVPAEALAGLPGLAPAGNGGFVLSWAKGLCPPGCDERSVCPEQGVSLEPLYELIRDRVADRPLEVIRSHLLVPGVGGFPLLTLRRHLRRVESNPGPNLVATLCRCHGVVHSLEMDQGGK